MQFSPPKSTKFTATWYCVPLQYQSCHNIFSLVIVDPMTRQMKVSSWEALMDTIDINGDGKISLEELERQFPPFTNSYSMTAFSLARKVIFLTLSDLPLCSRSAGLAIVQSISLISTPYNKMQFICSKVRNIFR
jgi:hypothetical protein